jgi:ribosomal protein L7Ae-like RNA K-turn-binding protein
MWLSASAVVIQQALKRGVFSRAAKKPVRFPPDLRDHIEATLRNRLIDLIGLARRSGNAVAGFEKGREWLVSGKAALIVQAADGSPEERARFAGSTKRPVVTAFSAAALGRIFGRDHVVHVAIAGGKLARLMEVDAARLAGVAGGPASGQ